jgi:hypothetical protein
MSLSGAPVPAFQELRDSRCTAHPAREAVALCRSCLTPRCGECVLKVDGVNHCAACLAAIFPPAPPASAAPPPRTATSVMMSLARAVAAMSVYSLVAVVAISAGVAYPFFANERLLAVNRVRVTNVHLALSSYFADTGVYPTRERGLAALLAAGPDDREEWRGPYTTARAPDGRPARNPGDEGKVLDVFGRPVVYWAAPVEEDDDDGVPDLVYVASPGANGSFETPGIYEGKAPRDPSGDDVVHWLVWP